MEVVGVADGDGGGDDGVRLRNNKGEYLTEDLSWSKNPTKEQIFTAVKQGEFQAFKSVKGEYLSLKDDGSLEMATICQAGWSKFNGTCYKLFSESKNWDGARTKCVLEKVIRSHMTCKYTIIMIC